MGLGTFNIYNCIFYNYRVISEFPFLKLAKTQLLFLPFCVRFWWVLGGSPMGTLLSEFQILSVLGECLVYVTSINLNPSGLDP